MNIITTLTSPQRNHDIYSSQKHLVDDEDTSEDIIVGTLHDVKHSKAVNDKTPAFKEKLIIIDKDEPDENIVEDDNEILSSPSIPELPDDVSIEHENDVVKEFHSPSSSSTSTCGKLRSTRPASDSDVENKDESKPSKVKSKRSKKNRFKYEKFKDNKALSVESADDSHEMETVKENNVSRSKIVERVGDIKIIGVHILNSDILENDLFLLRPLVKIYIVDSKKETLANNKKVVGDDVVDFSIETKCFDCNKNGTLIPKWDEIILFDNQAADNLLWSNVIIFFEIMDYDKKNVEKMRSIAWAFIKPIGCDNSNINKKLKLQLYEIQQLHSQSNKLNVYHYWRLKPWKKYPSVLNIAVLGSTTNNTTDNIDDFKYSMLNIKNEINNMSKNKYISNKAKMLSLNSLNIKKRLTDEPMEVPNKIIATLENGEGLTTAVKFSPCGKFLALSAFENNKYNVYIYKIPEFEISTKLSNHKGLIYEICWNSSSSQIVTASADSSACVWSVNEDFKWTKQQLHHPSFVYTAKFCKFDENVIATGCYDGIIRIWSTKPSSENNDTKFKLSDELSGHAGYINSICFMDYNEAFFSADSEGNIFKWAKGKNGWLHILEFNIIEFKGKIINDLLLFRDNKRMLVMIRNDKPWLLNLSSSSTSICYENGLINRYLIRGCLSHCETFVVVGSNIWKTSTGELCAVLNPVQFDHHSIISVDLHPFYNLKAVSCGRRNVPILLCYHVHVCDIDVNLRMEIYLSDMINCNRTSDELITLENSDRPKKIFKNTVLKLNSDLKKSTGHNKHLKLWDLLRKMDDLISMAKQSNGENTNEEFAESKESETESSKLESFNLNGFGKKTDGINSKQNDGLDSVKFSVENEKCKIDIKQSTFVNNKIDLEYSSTASNIESLEDDQNTYTINSPRNNDEK